MTGQHLENLETQPFNPIISGGDLAGSHAPKILIVDDVPLKLDMLEAVLKSEGLQRVLPIAVPQVSL